MGWWRRNAVALVLLVPALAGVWWVEGGYARDTWWVSQPHLAVAPGAQGAGLGAALLLDGLVWLRRWRVREALVNTQTGNDRAIALYERLGFERVPVFCVKRKNAINEPLFVSAPPEQNLNPYARIIVDEARRPEGDRAGDS